MNNRYIISIRGILSIAYLTLTLAVGGCGNKGKAPEAYQQALADIAVEYTKGCPKEQANGTKLESVTFKDNTMTFRMSLTDQAIAGINLDNARDSIVRGMSDNLRKYLANGKCNLEYWYVSPNDSSSITILPTELGYVEADGK